MIKIGCVGVTIERGIFNMKKKIEISGDNMKVTEFLEGSSVFTTESTKEMVKMTMTFENGVVAVQEVTPNGVKTSLTSPKPKEESEECKEDAKKAIEDAKSVASELKELIKSTKCTIKTGKLTESELEGALRNVRSSNKRAEDAVKNAEVASYPAENIHSDDTFIMLATDDEGRGWLAEHYAGGIRYSYI